MCVAYCVRSIYSEKKREIVSIRCASMLFVVVFIFICVDDDQSRISVPSPSENVMPKISPERVLHSSVTFILLFLCVSAVCFVCLSATFPSTQIFLVKGVSKKKKFLVFNFRDWTPWFILRMRAEEMSWEKDVCDVFSSFRVRPIDLNDFSVFSYIQLICYYNTFCDVHCFYEKGEHDDGRSFLTIDCSHRQHASV